MSTKSYIITTNCIKTQSTGENITSQKLHYLFTNETIKKNLRQLQIKMEKKYLETKKIRKEIFRNDDNKRCI